MCWLRSKQIKPLLRWSLLPAVLSCNTWSIRVRSCLSTRPSQWLATPAKKWMPLHPPRRKQKASQKKSQRSRKRRAVSLHQRQMKSPPPHRRPQQSRLHKPRPHPNPNHLLLARPEKMVTLKHLPLRRKSPAITKWIYPTFRVQDLVDVLYARMLNQHWQAVSRQRSAAHRLQQLMPRWLSRRKTRSFRRQNYARPSGVDWSKPNRRFHIFM